MTTLQDLYTQRRWVCYGADKVPINPHTGGNASSTKPSTWGTHAEAVAFREKRGVSGIGIMLTGDGIVGIDLDKCVLDQSDDVVTLAPFAKHLQMQAASYAEISPSGRGVHILGYAKITRSVKRQLHGIGVEVYGTARYLTVTEDTIGETTDLCDVQAIVDAIMDEITATDAPVVAHDLPPADTAADKWVAAILSKRLEAAKRMVGDAPDGQRHNARYAAGRLIGGYMAAAEAMGLHLFDDAKAESALFLARIPSADAQRKERATIRQGIRAGRLAPAIIPDRPQPVEMPKSREKTAVSGVEIQKRYQYTDIGNGERLRDATRDRLRYVEEWKQWLWFDGTRWQRTTTLQVKELAHAVIRGMLRSSADGEATDTELAKWALKSEATARVDAMIEEGKPYLRASPEEFDRYPDLLNAANGTIDLRTGELRPHNAEDMLTRIVRVAYRPERVADRWRQFLHTVFENDIELTQYAQRAVGYSLTGHTSEHCLFFCYGDGANGKSTFMRAVELISGDYTTTAQIDALLDHKGSGEGANPNIAGLFGMRVAMAQEMPEGGRFDESRVKAITGGDTIKARHLYGKPFEFRPTHTLWITGNHKPKITGTDAGIWRRLRIVPFVASIDPAQRRDSRHFEQQFAEDAEAMLAWAVDGAVLWYASGLGSCAAVDEATMAYRGEEDIVARFVQTMCVQGANCRADKTRLYAAWRQWAEDEGERGAAFKSQRWLLQNLAQRKFCGIEKRYITGLGLIAGDRDEGDGEIPVISRGAMRRGE